MRQSPWLRYHTALKARTMITSFETPGVFSSGTQWTFTCFAKEKYSQSFTQSPWMMRKLVCNRSENEDDGNSRRMIVLIVPDSVLDNTYQSCNAYALNRTPTFHITGGLTLRFQPRSRQFLCPEALRRRSNPYLINKMKIMWRKITGSHYTASSFEHCYLFRTFGPCLRMTVSTYSNDWNIDDKPLQNLA